ncbi:MAG: AfsA-related hotdog domain-containing protein [Sporichthyaceae bacterium]
MSELASESTVFRGRTGDPGSATLVLVGDQFRAFAAHPGVSTVSEFVGEVRSGHYDSPQGPIGLAWGQGTTPYDLEYVRDALTARALLDHFPIAPPPEPAAGRYSCHKRREANALVAGLRLIGEHRYSASLRLHPDNELQLDHQTGEHLQGLVVVEAFRQMLIAVCEQYVVIGLPPREYGYVWHSLAMSFDNFLFPIHTGLDCQFEHVDLSDARRVRMVATLHVDQAGTRCGTARIEFSALDARSMAVTEHRLARGRLDSLLGGSAARTLAEVG